jgi:3-hydroxymyristoyl/3-hydroxydecanoyl-(acyl carrier protein) dehydratase
MRFLFVDRILQLSPAQHIRGIKHITGDDPYLCDDGHGRLCFIPSLIGETLGQLAAWNVMSVHDFRVRPVAGIAASACLFRPAYVGETLLLESFIDDLDDSSVRYHSIARIGDEVVFTLNDALGPLLPMEDFIDAHEVRLQLSEINRPGDWPPVIPSEEQGAILDSPLLPRVSMSFDRILRCDAGVQLWAEKRISRSAPYFPDHFPKKPVLPMTVLLESKINLAQEFIKLSGLNADYQVQELRKIKMKEFVLPGDILICHLKLKQHEGDTLILSFSSEVAGKRVCVMEMSLVAKGF